MAMDSRTGSGDPSDSKPSATASDYAPDCPQGFFVTDGATTTGPFSPAEIRGRLAKGELTPQSFVCRQGWPNWKHMSQVAELNGQKGASSVTAMPPPIPKASSPARQWAKGTAAKYVLGLVLLVFPIIALRENAVDEALGVAMGVAWIWFLVRLGIWLVEKAKPGTTQRLSGALKQAISNAGHKLSPAPANGAVPAQMYLRRDDDSHVLCSVNEINAKLSAGEIAATDYVWQEGWLGWRKIADVDCFQPIPAAGTSSNSHRTANPTSAPPLPAVAWRKWLTMIQGTSPLRTGLIIAGVLALLWVAMPPAYQQIKQAAEARDPVMAQRTADAWRLFQAIEIKAGETGDPRSRLMMLMQLDLNQVDPLLVTHVSRTADVSKTYGELLARIQEELSARQAADAKAAEALSMMGAVVALLGSPRGSSGGAIQQNMQLGQQVGELAARVGSVLEAGDGKLKEKYGGQIAAIQSASAALVEERKKLAERLSQKYKRPFLTL